MEECMNCEIKLTNNKTKHSKCITIQCNHPLDPIEYECGYYTTIDCDECKYNEHGGRKDPEAKCNQQT